jgi:hypothetical protein
MRYIYIVLCLTFSSFALGNNHNQYLRIMFADFYSNDTLTMYINDKIIVTDYILNSDPSLGLTTLHFDGAIVKKMVLLKYLSKEFKYKVTDNKLRLSIILNGRCTKVVIDLKKGGYIDFSKKNNKNELDIFQSKTPFQYD